MSLSDPVEQISGFEMRNKSNTIKDIVPQPGLRRNQRTWTRARVFLFLAAVCSFLLIFASLPPVLVQSYCKILWLVLIPVWFLWLEVVSSGRAPSGWNRPGIIRSNVAYNLHLDEVLLLTAGHKTLQIKYKKWFRLNINDIQMSKKTVVCMLLPTNYHADAMISAAKAKTWFS